jgi:Peptidase family M23
MNRLVMLVGGAVALIVVCVAGTAVVVVGSVGSVCGPVLEVSAPPSPATATQWDAEQMGNATTIVSVGRSLQVPPRGWVIALATAMQESGLRNLGDLGADNDHDSLGLFQQRPSQGWGTPEQVMDPEYASTRFYRRLVKVAGWMTMPLTEAAQAVQRSAFPDAYAKHEAAATALAYSIDGTAVADCLAGVAAGGWVMPVNGPIVSGFRTQARAGHDGIDLAAARGTPIRAAAAGVVITLQCNASLNGRPYPCDKDGSPAVAGCGYYSEVLSAGNIVSRYCHQLVSPPLALGQAVAAGQVIGMVGSSGNSSGPHLHLEFHRGNPATPDNAVDPVVFLRSVGVSLAP